MEKQLCNLVKNSAKKRSTTVTKVIQCRLYKGEKTQQDHEVMESISDESKAQKDWPRKCFQKDKNETYESAMMCWESLDDSEQASKKRKTSGQDTNKQ